MTNRTIHPTPFSFVVSKAQTNRTSAQPFLQSTPSMMRTLFIYSVIQRQDFKLSSIDLKQAVETLTSVNNTNVFSFYKQKLLEAIATLQNLEDALSKVYAIELTTSFDQENIKHYVLSIKADEGTPKEMLACTVKLSKA